MQLTKIEKDETLMQYIHVYTLKSYNIVFDNIDQLLDTYIKEQNYP